MGGGIVGPPRGALTPAPGSPPRRLNGASHGAPTGTKAPTKSEPWRAPPCLSLRAPPRMPHRSRSATLRMGPTGFHHANCSQNEPGETEVGFSRAASEQRTYSVHSLGAGLLWGATLQAAQRRSSGVGSTPGFTKGNAGATELGWKRKLRSKMGSVRFRSPLSLVSAASWQSMSASRKR